LQAGLAPSPTSSAARAQTRSLPPAPSVRRAIQPTRLGWNPRARHSRRPPPRRRPLRRTSHLCSLLRSLRALHHAMATGNRHRRWPTRNHLPSAAQRSVDASLPRPRRDRRRPHHPRRRLPALPLGDGRCRLHHRQPPLATHSQVKRWISILELRHLYESVILSEASRSFIARGVVEGSAVSSQENRVSVSFPAPQP